MQRKDDISHHDHAVKWLQRNYVLLH